MTAALTIGTGVTIPIAPTGNNETQIEAADRARAFDNTYRLSVTGNQKRQWSFTTPPVRRANADLIKLMLNKKVAQSFAGDLIGNSSNMFTFSEEFDNAAWTKTNLSITPNATRAPDATNTADKLVENTAVTVAHVIERTFAGVAGSTYTLSDYALQGGRSWASLQITGKDTTARGAYFDLANGVLGSIDTGVTASITPIADGWYRCAIAATVGSGGSTPVAGIYPSPSNGGRVYTGNGTDGIYTWGAQLEPGAVANSYVPVIGSAGSPVVTPISCFSEITSWTPVKAQPHLVVIGFNLYEV